MRHLRSLFGGFEYWLCVLGKAGQSGLRIHACAEGGASFLAISTASVGDVEGHHDSVAFLEERDARASLYDCSHVFMSWIVLAMLVVIPLRSRIGIPFPHLGLEKRMRAQGRVPKHNPPCAAVLPWYICRSDPQIAAVVTLTRQSSGCSSLGRGRSSIDTLKGSVTV